MAILSVITNGLQVAIESNVIPRIAWSLNHDSSHGFAKSTFSTFTTSDFANDVVPYYEVVNGTEFENVTECSFIGQYERIKMNQTVNYVQKDNHWKNIFARTLFFIVFEVCRLFKLQP